MAKSNDDLAPSTRRAIRDILGPQRHRVLAVAMASLLAGLLEAVFLVLVTRSILAVADGDSGFDLAGRTLTVDQAAALGAALLAGRLAMALTAIRIQTTLFHRMLVSLRGRLGDAFIGAAWPVQRRQARGALQHLLVTFPASVVSLGYQLIQALVGGLSLLALLIVAFIIDPLTSLMVLLVVSVLASSLWPVRRAIRRRAQQAVDRQNHLATRISEIDDLALEIGSMGVRSEAARVLRRSIDAEGVVQRRLAMMRDTVAPMYTTLAYLAMVAAVVILDQRGSGDLQATGSVLLIMLRSLAYGQQLQHGSSALGQLSPVTRQLDERLDEFESSRDERGRLDARQVTTFDSIVVDHVSFAHPGHDAILHDVTFSVQRGEIVGITGPSGAGKTTLVQLVLGLQQPTHGCVVVDGTDLVQVDSASWGRLVGVVPQEARLLDGTLADNVRFWRTELDDSDIEQALALADLALDPDRFPLGIHTDLGAAGREFSGGQRQRLAIARALAARPSLLVLDEPTSSLDADAEEAITATIARLRGSVAVIVVSHRAATLAVCDRVLTVADGRVNERR